MEKICKNCKYYSKDNENEGSCSNRNIRTPDSKYAYQDDVWGNIEVPKNGLFAGWDDDRGALIVSETFGCINFEYE